MDELREDKMRTPRVIRYIAYVAAVLSFQGLIAAGVARFSAGDASALTYAADAAAMMLPLVILQLVVALLAVRAPSLFVLFLLYPRAP